MTCFNKTRVVTAPTPPGTGVMASGHFFSGFSIDIAEKLVIFDIDTDVYNDSARFNVVPGNHFGLSDGGYQDVGPAAYRGPNLWFWSGKWSQWHFHLAAA